MRVNYPELQHTIIEHSIYNSGRSYLPGMVSSCHNLIWGSAHYCGRLLVGGANLDVESSLNLPNTTPF